jgi:hypothetical protein
MRKLILAFTLALLLAFGNRAAPTFAITEPVVIHTGNGTVVLSGEDAERYRTDPAFRQQVDQLLR